MRYRAMAAVILGFATAGCTNSLPVTVTPSGLRMLSIGMTEAQVVKVIGAPLGEIPGRECATRYPESTKCWRYHSIRYGGVRIWLELGRDGLAACHVYTKYKFDDRDTPLLHLSREERIEYPAFARFFGLPPVTPAGSQD